MGPIYKDASILIWREVVKCSPERIQLSQYVLWMYFLYHRHENTFLIQCQNYSVSCLLSLAAVRWPCSHRLQALLSSTCIIIHCIYPWNFIVTGKPGNIQILLNLSRAQTYYLWSYQHVYNVPTFPYVVSWSDLAYSVP